MEQMLILVDQQDNCIGYAPRNECHSGSGRLHRAITVLIFNSQEKILLQRRKSLLWDKFWDIAGATHPMHYPDYDETYDDAALRFLRTEWNIATPLERVFSFIYFARFNAFCEREHCVLLAGQHDGPIRLSPHYGYGMRWTSLAECVSEIQQSPEIYTPWAQIVVKKLSAQPFAGNLSALVQLSSASSPSVR